MTDDFYTLLEIPEDASQDQIKRAFREKVRIYHPDHNDDDRAQAQFTALKKAYDTLGDPVERKAYDRLGHRNYVSKRLEGLPSPEKWAPSKVEEEKGSTGSEDSGSTGSNGSRRSSSGRSSGSGRASAGRSSGGRSSEGRSSGGPSSGGRSTRTRRTSTGNSSRSSGSSTGSSTDSGGSTSRGTSTGTTTTESTSSTRGTNRTRSSRRSRSSPGGSSGGSTATEVGSRRSATDGSGATATGAGTAGTTGDTGDGGLAVRLLSIPAIRWLVGWPMVYLAMGVYLAGIGWFAAARQEPLAAAWSAVAQAGVDAGALWAALAESRHGVPPAVDVDALAAGTVEPSAALLVVGALVLPAVLFVLIRLTRATPGWKPTYLYVVLACGPLVGLGITAGVGPPPIGVDLLTLVAAPVVAVGLLVASAYLRPVLLRRLA